MAAAQVALRPACFSGFFHRKLGCTFPAYVTQLRIAHAMQLMLEENMRIADACFASGFNNLSHFNQQFRRVKGMNPRTYPRHMRPNSSEPALR
ncbi:MAG TPA: helix-turn-helix transcriptional regulator [Opitutus sp.]|nr:helix-turn-helix transcriptional regulator [Opitutus sp.]